MSALNDDVLRAIAGSQIEHMDAGFLRSILHSQLQHISPETREKSAEVAVAQLRQTLNKAGIGELPALPADDHTRMQDHLAEMRRDGITLLGPVINTGQLKEIHSYLDTKKLFGSHVWTFSDHNPKPKAEIKENHGQGCYILEDVLAAPHLLETMSSPFVLKLVEQYLGCVPTVFQSNLMWSFQKKLAQPAVAQAFHRDWDNFRFCVLFVYLTDVDGKTGAHQYIRNTHTVKGLDEAIERYRAKGNKVDEEKFYREAIGLNDSKMNDIFGDAMLQIERPAGYAFLTDAFGLHRGLPLVEGERLLFWARYGLYDNGYSIDVTPAPLPRTSFAGRMSDDAAHRYIFRSVLQSEYTASQVPASMHASPDEFETLCNKILARFGQRPFVNKAIKLVMNRLRGRKLKIDRELKLDNTGK